MGEESFEKRRKKRSNYAAFVDSVKIFYVKKGEEGI